MSISKTIEPLIHKYPVWLKYSAIGSRVMGETGWNTGIKKNIPRHYKNFYLTWKIGPQEHIHSKPNPANFERDEFGEIAPVQNPRIYVVYPQEFHEGLWGGEGVVKGLKARPETRHRSFTPPTARFWWPRLFKGVVRSEILGTHIEMVMTHRGLSLVDKSYGLDNYILKTPVNEIYAWKLLKLKREMLLKLTDKDNFAGGNTDIYDKYQEFCVSHEEADWTGLTLQEAIKKQISIESNKSEAEKIPLKSIYREELVHLLKSGHLDDLDPELALQEQGKSQGGVFSSIKNAFK